MRPHIFIDETKERGLLIVAAYLDQAVLAEARQVMRLMVLPGQRSIHFCKERDQRRRMILAAIRGLAVEAIVYDARAYRSVKAARDACLIAVVADAGKADAERIIIEMDDSNLRADKVVLGQRLRVEGLAGRLRYDHLRAHEDSLLAIPDALAWSWAKGGEWKATVQPIVSDVRTLDPNS